MVILANESFAGAHIEDARTAYVIEKEQLPPLHLRCMTVIGGRDGLRGGKMGIGSEGVPMIAEIVIPTDVVA